MLSKRIKGFDGVRAIAFLLVFISHKLPTPFTDHLGSVAVWIFFVLSGFLITRILAAERSRVETGTTSSYQALIGFYRNRVFRIFPPYYALLAVLSVLAVAGHYDLESAGRLWANLLFYSNMYIERHGWRDDLGHLWSLAVEQQYYLLFAPLVLFIPRLALPALCAALVAVSVLAHVVLIALAAPDITFDVNSFINMGLFGLGGLAGLFAGRPLPRWLLNDVLIVAAFIIFLAVAALPAPYCREYGRLAAVLVACILVQIAQHQDGVVVRALEFAPVRWIGLISYGAYLFHPVIHSGVLLSSIGLDAHLARRWIIGGDFLISIALASVSWLLLEAPLIRFAARVRRPAAATPQTSSETV